MRSISLLASVMDLEPAEIYMLALGSMEGKGR